MAQREHVEPILNARGEESHPAFAIASVSRLSHGGGGASLFDSDVLHQHTILLTVSGATRARQGSHDYIHEDGLPVVQVEMSQAQWAALVSSIDSPGVPVTLRSTQTDHQVPGLPYDPRLGLSIKETREAALKMMSEINDALATYEKALADKASAKERNEALKALHSKIKNATPNVEYASKTLSRHAENVVQKARADIEAMVTSRATQMGLSAGDTEALALPLMPSEQEG